MNNHVACQMVEVSPFRSERGAWHVSPLSTAGVQGVTGMQFYRRARTILELERVNGTEKWRVVRASRKIHGFDTSREYVAFEVVGLLEQNVDRMNEEQVTFAA